jgi:hypothetical protein
VRRVGSNVYSSYSPQVGNSREVSEKRVGPGDRFGLTHYGHVAVKLHRDNKDLIQPYVL